MCCRSYLWVRGAERGRLGLEELGQNSWAVFRTKPGKMLSPNGNRYLANLKGCNALPSPSDRSEIWHEGCLLLPPWKVNLHFVKCPKPNCTVCIFSRCLLGHVHILLRPSLWPDNTRDMSKYSNTGHSHDLPPLVTHNRGLWQQSPRCYIMNLADEGRWHTYATLGCLPAFWHFS